MRLIDADKVNETIDRFIGYLDEDMILRIKMKISAIPTAERPHGEWITKKDSLQTYCSHCDTAIPYSDEYDFSDFILCPYCGADMRKEGDPD